MKLTEVEFAGTVTVAGKMTALSLLERFTLKPPVVAAAFRVTEHESVAAAETEDKLHFSPVIPGVPEPVRLIFVAPTDVVPVPTNS